MSRSSASLSKNSEISTGLDKRIKVQNLACGGGSVGFISTTNLKGRLWS